MNSIPLIKGNTPQEINTSIIALKKALGELDRLLQGTDKDVQDKIKQINELIERINNHLTTIDSQITALQPVDSVTSGNMQSVTSNAVSEALKNGIYVGSCVLWNETTVLTGTQDLQVLGAYDYRLIDFSVTVPTGFHKEFVLSAQVSTTANISAYVKLNNISTYPKITWSIQTFREISSSERFLLSDIILEPILYYNAPGINLHLCSDSAENDYKATIYGVTLSCFLVKD